MGTETPISCHSPAKRSLRLCPAVWASILLLAQLLPAAAERPADQWRAATLSKMIPYVKWPGSAASFTVGLYGEAPDGPFGLALRRMLPKSVKGRPVRVIQVSTREAALGCQILYVAKAKSGDWAKSIRPIEGQLTVSEDPGFTTRVGGVCSISFLPRRKLTISRGNAKRAKLKISSRLYKIAEMVD